MQQAYLVVDTRERYVIPFISADFAKAGEKFVVHQINTGDYLICRSSSEIIACIERKTLKDFASSFCDGRYENLSKMLALRDKTGCQLYFFVEGPAFPNPSRKYNHIAYSSILSAMTNMMLRDGVQIVQTENETHTSKRLLDFVKALHKIVTPFCFVASKHEIDNTNCDIPAMLSGVIERSDDDICVDIWSRLPGISTVTGKILYNALSVAELISEKNDDSCIRNLRNQNNRNLSQKIQNYLFALRQGYKIYEWKILSGVPGISISMATQLLDGRSLNTLLTMTAKEIGMLPLQQKSRSSKLGIIRAQRILRLLYHTSTKSNDSVVKTNDTSTKSNDSVVKTNDTSTKINDTNVKDDCSAKTNDNVVKTNDTTTLKATQKEIDDLICDLL
jgi:ERCC4-type nuclease